MSANEEMGQYRQFSTSRYTSLELEKALTVGHSRFLASREFRQIRGDGGEKQSKKPSVWETLKKRFD